MPDCIAISSQKGGVAKTTTCLSLGASLAELGLSILVVDLDPQAHLTQALSIDPESVRNSISEVLLNQVTLIQASRETSFQNLDLVPSNRGLILVEKFFHSAKGYEYRLKGSLEQILGQFYDIVLLDCPPSFGPLTVNALTAAQLVIIPVTCDFFSLQSLQSYLNLLKLLNQNTNAAINYRLLITMFDKRTRVSQMFLDQFQRKFPSTLFGTVIPIDARLRESTLFGRPITQYASKARSAQEYRSLARELLTCLKVTV